MAIAILVGVIVVLLVFMFLVVFGGMLVNIGGQQVGIIERRNFGRDLPQQRVVAMKDVRAGGRTSSARVTVR